MNPAILPSRDLIQFANPSDHIKQSYFLPVSSNCNAFQEIDNRQILNHWHTEYDQQTHPNLHPKRWQASKQCPFISVVPLGSVKIWCHDSSLSSYLSYNLFCCLLGYFFQTFYKSVVEYPLPVKQFLQPVSMNNSDFSSKLCRVTSRLSHDAMGIFSKGCLISFFLTISS